MAALQCNYEQLKNKEFIHIQSLHRTEVQRKLKTLLLI